MKPLEITSEKEYMELAIPHLKVVRDEEGVAGIVVAGRGAYTVGMAQHGLPDVVILSTADSAEWVKSLGVLVTNFFTHVQMMSHFHKQELVVEHDAYETNGQTARFKLRMVDLNNPWEHLLMLRDAAPNDRVVQLHVPDDQNRVYGEFGYDMNHSMSSVRFEDRSDFFC